MCCFLFLFAFIEQFYYFYEQFLESVIAYKHLFKAIISWVFYWNLWIKVRCAIKYGFSSTGVGCKWLKGSCLNWFWSKMLTKHCLVNNQNSGKLDWEHGKWEKRLHSSLFAPFEVQNLTQLWHHRNENCLIYCQHFTENEFSISSTISNTLHFPERFPSTT